MHAYVVFAHPTRRSFTGRFWKNRVKDSIYVNWLDKIQLNLVGK